MKVFERKKGVEDWSDCIIEGQIKELKPFFKEKVESNSTSDFKIVSSIDNKPLCTGGPRQCLWLLTL